MVLTTDERQRTPISSSSTPRRARRNWRRRSAKPKWSQRSARYQARCSSACLKISTFPEAPCAPSGQRFGAFALSHHEPRTFRLSLQSALSSGERHREHALILLSARAGEESRVEGLQAGADDYLVKTFTARELLARVEAHLKLANFRRDTAEREERLRSEAELERQRLRASQDCWRRRAACIVSFNSVKRRFAHSRTNCIARTWPCGTKWTAPRCSRRLSARPTR